MLVLVAMVEGVEDGEKRGEGVAEGGGGGGRELCNRGRHGCCRRMDEAVVVL